jgi:hypothetical protein
VARLRRHVCVRHGARKAVTPKLTSPKPIFSQGSSFEDGARLLLLSQHFPPGQAAGARRWEKLARFAAERGWGLDVFTLAPEDLRAADFDRLDSLPEGTRVFGIRAREHWLSRVADRTWESLRRWRSKDPAAEISPDASPAKPPAPIWLKRSEVTYGLLTLSGWRRTYHAAMEFANDAAWASAAAQMALQVYDAALHRAVMSCGPPHMVHRAACGLARRVGLPLIVDLRDPWSHAERVHGGVASPLWFRLAHRFESRAFEQASLIVMNTPAAHEAMRRAYPAYADKLIYVTNGFDDDALPEPTHSKAFVLAYAGAIYADRSPRNLFRAVRIVADELGLGAEDLQVELMGHFDVDTIAEMSRQERVHDHVTLHPAGSIRDVADLLSRAAILVNLHQDSDLAIPSKIFEYMVYPSWLLALAERDTATGQILAGTAADVIHPEDVEGIARVIMRCYEAYRKGVRPEPVANHAELGRAHQAAVLFDALEDRVGPAVGPPIGQSSDFAVPRNSARTPSQES